jgi:hypothetical protein
MTSRNRVTPTGDIEAFPLRGAWTGNRGILHVGREIVRFHASDLWITCALEFRGRWREQWLPNRWTHLYFHDEAVSFATTPNPASPTFGPGESHVRAPRGVSRTWNSPVLNVGLAGSECGTRRF